MNYALIAKALGLLFVGLAAALLFPFGTALYYQEADTAAFGWSALGIFLLGTTLYIKNREARSELRNRDAFLLVGLAWFLVTICGAFPFYFSGAYPSVVDAWFESASGFTTTGATVSTEIESLSHAVLLWRSLAQYLGGMGIIVLSLAILPLLGVGGMELYRAEAPGPTTDKIGSRVSETARALWYLYLGFMVLETVILCFLGMSFFDAVNHGLTTMASGGFSTKNDSVAGFDSPAIEAVITFFMFLAGASFLLHYRFFIRRDLKVFKSPEFRFYITLIAASIVLIAVYLWGDTYQTFSQALRFAAFQVVSLISSTGYATADFLYWGPFAQAVLVAIMICGGCAGSTAGGIKCVRAMMLIKQGFRELYVMVHPSAVYPLKLGGRTIERKVASSIFAFFFLYIVILAITTLFLTATGVDLVTATSATISALSNIGPGLGEVGPMLNYSGLPDLAKLLLASCMIVGRLEIFTILVLFTSEFWKS